MVVSSVTRVFVQLLGILLLSVGWATAQPMIEIGSTAEFEGPVAVEFSSGGADVVSIALDIVFPAGTQLRSCRLAGDLSGAAELTSVFSPADCDAGRDCASVSLQVVAVGDRTIPDHSELVRCWTSSFAASEQTRRDLSCANLQVVDAFGSAIDADCTGGIVSVPAAQVHVAIGTTTITPEGRGQFDVTLELLEPGLEVVGVENRIAFDRPIQIEKCAIDPRIMANYGFGFAPQACVPGVDCTSLYALLLDFSAGPRPFPEGVLYRCDVVAMPTGSSAATVPNDPAGIESATVPLRCSLPGASDPAGNLHPTTCSDGTIRIAAATATPTPTATTIAATATVRATATRTTGLPTLPPDPSATPSPLHPTVTPTVPTQGNGGSCSVETMRSDQSARPSWAVLAVVWIYIVLTKRRGCVRGRNERYRSTGP